MKARRYRKTFEFERQGWSCGNKTVKLFYSDERFEKLTKPTGFDLNNYILG